MSYFGRGFDMSTQFEDYLDDAQEDFVRIVFRRDVGNTSLRTLTCLHTRARPQPPPSLAGARYRLGVHEYQECEDLR